MLVNQGQGRRLAARTPGGCLHPRALQEQASTCMTAQASNNVWCCVGPLVDLIGLAMYNSSMARPPRLQASLSASIEECRIAPSTNQLRQLFAFLVSMIGLSAFGR